MPRSSAAGNTAIACYRYRLKTAHILDTNYLRENRSIEEYAIEEFSVEEHEKIHGRLVLCINEHRRALA